MPTTPPGNEVGPGPTMAGVRPAVVFDTVEELLAGADSRGPFTPAQSRSTSGFERVWIDGRPLVVKYLHPDDDFMMRALGDTGCRTLRAYEAGLFDVAGDVIDHAVIGAARGVGRNGWGHALLMRDVSAELVPPGDDPFPGAQHEQFVDHLAQLCARTWGWHDDLGLVPYATRWTFTGLHTVDVERAVGGTEAVVPVIAEGLAAFDSRAPRDVVAAVGELRRDVFPLADALAATPSCFLHGDWKASNLGSAPDGRTVLIDWVYLGEGPACHELGWYLALNRRKLPAPKETVIDDFRAALERHGVDSSGWWDVQLRLALLGTVVEFGWEKALGDDDELGWWCDRAREGIALL